MHWGQLSNNTGCRSSVLAKISLVAVPVITNNAEKILQREVLECEEHGVTSVKEFSVAHFDACSFPSPPSTKPIPGTKKANLLYGSGHKSK